MSKDAKELCLVVLVVWLVGSGIWSCGSQMWHVASIVLNHVVLK
jgi:hypothetical protein